jgi:chromosome segregation ATPase
MESSPEREHSPAAERAAALAQIEREIADGQARLRERQLRQRAAISQLKGVRGALSDMAWELEELERRLDELQAQREGPDDPLAERELSSMRGRRATLEEQLLAIMLQADQLAAEIAAEEQALAEASAAWAAHEAELRAEREQLAALPE